MDPFCAAKWCIYVNIYIYIHIKCIHFNASTAMKPTNFRMDMISLPVQFPFSHFPFNQFSLRLCAGFFGSPPDSRLAIASDRSAGVYVRFWSTPCCGDLCLLALQFLEFWKNLLGTDIFDQIANVPGHFSELGIGLLHGSWQRNCGIQFEF